MTDQTPTPEQIELQQRLHEASQLTDQGAWAEAYALLQEQEAGHPRDPMLLCMLGVVAGEMEARGLAYEYFRRCLAEQPTDPHLLVMLGAGLARFDDPDAEGVLRLAAITAPGLAVTRQQYGTYLSREGLFDAARAELEEAARLDPGSGEIRRELGIAALLGGDTDRGLEELEAALGLLAEEDEARALFGLALLRAGRDDEAAEELHRAGAELAHDGELQLAVALACAGQEWDEPAWDALARAEVAEFSADAGLVREVEEAIEAGAAAAQELLREQVGPALLHDRLFARP